MSKANKTLQAMGLGQFPRTSKQMRADGIIESNETSEGRPDIMKEVDDLKRVITEFTKIPTNEVSARLILAGYRRSEITDITKSINNMISNVK